MPAGTIYDIGYRGYDGPRLGRLDIVGALVGHGLRTTAGIGRGARAKVAPVALFALAVLPAVLQAWLAAATQDEEMILGYPLYLQQIQQLLLLFCAAQAPELVSRDQQHRVLPLYLSRPLHHSDYAAGRLAALALSVAAVAGLGQFIMFIGRAFTAGDVVTGLRANWQDLLPMAGSALVVGLLLAAISLAIASFMAKRAVASVAIIAFFLIAAALSPLFTLTLPEDWSRYAVLLNPVVTASGATHWFFGDEAVAGTMLSESTLAGPVFGLATAVWILAAAGVLFARYRSLRT
jgi:ABC-2 type transport system permease protein